MIPIGLSTLPVQRRTDIVLTESVIANRYKRYGDFITVDSRYLDIAFLE